VKRLQVPALTLPGLSSTTPPLLHNHRLGGGSQEFTDSNTNVLHDKQRQMRSTAVPTTVMDASPSDLIIASACGGPSHVVHDRPALTSTDALNYATIHIQSGPPDWRAQRGADSPIALASGKAYILMKIMTSR